MVIGCSSATSGYRSVVAVVVVVAVQPLAAALFALQVQLVAVQPLAAAPSVMLVQPPILVDHLAAHSSHQSTWLWRRLRTWQLARQIAVKMAPNLARQMVVRDLHVRDHA
jgi:hypothetical protein